MGSLFVGGVGQGGGGVEEGFSEEGPKTLLVHCN